MKNVHKMYPYPYWSNTPIYNSYNMDKFHKMSEYNYWLNRAMYNLDLKDYGPEPFVINIDTATMKNNTYRTALWTGKNLQVTLMSIPIGEDIGLEVHPAGDQFIRIEQGKGLVEMGDRKDSLDYQEELYDDYAIMIPAGKWHNVINTGDIPLKLYAVYAPPEHPRDTIHETKADAEAAEKNYGY